MEPLDLYDKIQPLVIADAQAVIDKALDDSKYNIAVTQAHQHNGSDAVQLQTNTALSDYKSYLAYNSITLTPAQIKALNTTPITIVQAPVPANPSGSTGTTPKAVIIVDSIVARLTYGGTAYTGANNLEFRYTNGSGAKVTADIGSAWLDSSASAYQCAPAVTAAFAPVANAPIVVSVPTANPGAGNSPITFTIHYRIVAFSS